MRVGLREQRVELGQCSEHRIDIGVIADVIAEVGHGGGEDRREPDGVDAEFGEIGQAPADAGKIADTVAARVRERARGNLIDDAGLPPAARRDGQLSTAA